MPPIIRRPSTFFYGGVHEIRHFCLWEIFINFEIICIRHNSGHSISHKIRYHVNKTLFDPQNFSQKDPHNANKTFSSNLYLMKMSYSHDFDLFEMNFMTRMLYSHDCRIFEGHWMARNMSHTYDFVTKCLIYG